MNATNIWNSFVCILFIHVFIFYSVYRIIIMHEALSLSTKKLIAQNFKPPLFLPKLP